jgi:hypothetical protein
MTESSVVVKAYFGVFCLFFAIGFRQGSATQHLLFQVAEAFEFTISPQVLFHTLCDVLEMSK